MADTVTLDVTMVVVSSIMYYKFMGIIRGCNFICVFSKSDLLMFVICAIIIVKSIIELSKSNFIAISLFN